MRRNLGVDIQFLQASQDVEILVLALNQQQVTADEDFVAARHDFQLAVAKDRNHTKVEHVSEAALLKRGLRQVAVLRQAHDKNSFVGTVLFFEFLARQDLHAVEIYKLFEFAP